MRTRVETGSGYELLGAAIAIAMSKTSGRPSAFAGDDERVVATLVSGGREPLINAVGFLAGAADGPSSDQLIDGLRSLGGNERLRVLLGYYRRSIRRATDPAVIYAATEGEPEARRRFLASSFPDLDHWQQSLRYFLADDGVQRAVLLVDTLEALAPMVPEPDRAIAGELERARGLVASTPVDLAIERLTGAAGITFARAIGHEDVVISPRGAGPGIYVVSDYGATLVVSYPAEASTASPPAWLMALGRALGDDRRLRILRMLASKPLTIAELSERLGIPRTSLQYHLAILREAGLVGWSVDDAESGPLTLRRSGLDDIAPGLSRYLGLSDPPKATRGRPSSPPR